MTWPVCVAHELRLRPVQRADADRGSHLAGVDAVGAGGEDQYRLPAGVEQQAVGDRADLAAERLGRQRGGVDRVGEDDDAAGPPAADSASRNLLMLACSMGRG